MSDQEIQGNQVAPAVTDEESPISLTAQLQKAQALLSDESDDTIPTTDNHPHHQQQQQQIHPPSVRAIKILENIQDQIQRSSLFSTNESLDDVQSSSLVLIATEYHLGKAYLQLPTTITALPASASINNSSIIRNKHVRKALEFFHLFLERCDVLEGLLEDAVTKDYRSILLTHQNNDDDNDDDNDIDGTLTHKTPIHTSRMPSPSSHSNRDTKIARYRQTQTLKSQTAHLNALLSQRQRLQLASHEDLDGHDEDTLRRSLSISMLNLYSVDCLEELTNCGRELEMLAMAVQRESQRNSMAHHTGNHNSDSANSTHHTHDTRQRPPQTRKPLNLTHVTQSASTGQLIFRKEQIQSTIFRPSWNQPTMTLEELAEKEVAEATIRSEKQAEAEEVARKGPRRYDQLVKDGLEDDADLVEASAVLDRKWDDWKDANPRGSGNKMGDRGDRNF